MTIQLEAVTNEAVTSPAGDNLSLLAISRRRSVFGSRVGFVRRGSARMSRYPIGSASWDSREVTRALKSALAMQAQILMLCRAVAGKLSPASPCAPMFRTFGRVSAKRSQKSVLVGR